MKREDLNILTKISFFTALAEISVIPAFAYISSIISNESSKSILHVFMSLAFFASLFGIPLSIVSMFSKENLAKRIFALIFNLLPIGLIICTFIVLFINEFFETPP